jgi:hypothetical protein
VECFFCLDLAGEGGGEEVVEVTHDTSRGGEHALLFLGVWQAPNAVA